MKILAILLTAGYIFTRTHFGKKYELKNNDLILFGIMIFIALLLGNKLEYFEFLGIRTKIFNAANQKIQDQIISENEFPLGKSITVKDIPLMMKKNMKGIQFKLGNTYNAVEVEKIFNILNPSSYLEYLIILDEKDEFFGVYNASDYIASLKIDEIIPYTDKLITLLKDFDKVKQGSSNGQIITNKDIFLNSSLFINLDKAVKQNIKRHDALKKMKVEKINFLPIIDNDNNFIGIVKRSELNTDLILDIIE